MDDTQNRIFSYSDKVMGRLKLLSVFFEEEALFKIYVRTQVIHRLFQSNPELDIHKLELFHLQFTETIIELLKKVKTNNEKKVIQVTDEIQVNEELIGNLSDSIQLEQSFANAAKGHTTSVGRSLKKLYENLSDYARDNPFPKTIADFSAVYAKDFFYEVPPEMLFALLEHEPQKLYKNGYGAIEKKLMGLQCKHGFKNHFHFGLKSKDTVVEVYRLQDFIREDDDNEYFVFLPARRLFLGVEEEALKMVKTEGKVSKKAGIILELNAKNALLKSSLPALKTIVPPEVANLLADYQQRIERIDFLDLIDDFDIQANILKTMLNTDSI